MQLFGNIYLRRLGYIVTSVLKLNSPSWRRAVEFSLCIRGSWINNERNVSLEMYLLTYHLKRLGEISGEFRGMNETQETIETSAFSSFGYRTERAIRVGDSLIILSNDIC